mgnify:CR=1 FL=1
MRRCTKRYVDLQAHTVSCELQSCTTTKPIVTRASLSASYTPCSTPTFLTSSFPVPPLPSPSTLPKTQARPLSHAHTLFSPPNLAQHPKPHPPRPSAFTKPPPCLLQLICLKRQASHAPTKTNKFFLHTVAQGVAFEDAIRSEVFGANDCFGILAYGLELGSRVVVQSLSRVDEGL